LPTVREIEACARLLNAGAKFVAAIASLIAIVVAMMRLL